MTTKRSIEITFDDADCKMLEHICRLAESMIESRRPTTAFPSNLRLDGAELIKVESLITQIRTECGMRR